MPDLRETGAIEQDADIICFLTRPIDSQTNDYVMGRGEDGKRLLLIEKNRNGQCGDIELIFSSEQLKFLNYASEYKDDSEVPF